MTKKWLIGLCLTLWAFGAAAQKDLTQIQKDILSEANALYHRETASWHATDILTTKYRDLLEKLGGYLSYQDGDEYATIFWDRDDQGLIILKISFKDTSDPTSTTITQNVLASPEEKNLIGLRIAAKEIVNANADKFFKFYQRSSLNLIPIIEGNVRKVVILCGPSINGVVIFGNDYEMTFDQNNKLLSKKKLHSSLIDLDTKSANTTGEKTTYHTHIKKYSPFITPTDICTLMLYAHLTDWKKHIVKSKKYVSTWNMETQTLVIMTTKELKEREKFIEKATKEALKSLK